MLCVVIPAEIWKISAYCVARCVQPWPSLMQRVLFYFRSLVSQINGLIATWHLLLKWCYSRIFVSDFGGVIFKVWPLAAASPGTLLEIQTSSPHSRPAESDILGVGPSNLCFNKPSRWYWCILEFDSHWLRVFILVLGSRTLILFFRGI